MKFDLEQQLETQKTINEKSLEVDNKKIQAMKNDFEQERSKVQLTE